MTQYRLLGLVGLTIIGSLFLSLHKTKSIGETIVINEIGAFEQGGYEWIEIYNAGDEYIDMSEWKFWENDTNHSLSIVQGTTTISPNQYAIIAQDAASLLEEYTIPSTTIFDSSWGSLKESGEEIGLKDQTGTLIELFTYPSSSDFSLERIDTAVHGSEPSNWIEHPSGTSIGKVNYWSLHSSEELIDISTSTPTSTPELPTTTVSTTKSHSSSTPTTTEPTGHIPSYTLDPSGLVINEIVSNPESGNEWVELFHTGTTTISTTLELHDGADRIGTYTVSVPSSSHVVLELTSSKLNNSGDTVSLIFGSSTIDTVTYGDWDGAQVSAPKKGQSIIRQSDGDQTLVVSDKITKGFENIYVYEQEESETDYEREETPESPSSPQKVPSPSLLQSKSGDVHVTELYPNPPGADTDAEFIELFNAGESPIYLSEWKIGDGSTKKFTFQDHSIQPNQYLVLYRTESGIALNNSGEESVTLYAPNETIIDSVEYTGTVKEGESFAKENDRFYWTSMPTPGDKNIIEEPVVEDLQTDDPQTDQDETKVTVEKSEEIVDAYITDSAQHIQISEFLPNPVGSEDAEFIELYNPLSSPVDISYLKLDDEEGGSRTYTIPEGTLLGGLSYASFSRTETGIALNNTGDSVRLLYPDGSIISSVTYESVIEGASYVKDSFDSWIQTQSPTPGIKNIIETIEGKENISEEKRERGTIQTSLYTLRTQDIGDRVSVTGTVAVLPGILGSQYFYIVGSPGVQIYSYKKEFPEIIVGDQILVTGELVESNGESRIKLSSVDDITILEPGPAPEPKELDILDAGENYEGWLVQIDGEVTEKKSSHLWIDDGTDEIKIYIKKGTSISTKELSIGDTVSVIGLVSQTKSGYQILPRSQEDLQVLKKSTAQEAVEKIENTSSKKQHIATYLSGGSIGLGLVLIALLVRYKKNSSLKKETNDPIKK